MYEDTHGSTSEQPVIQTIFSRNSHHSRTDRCNIKILPQAFHDLSFSDCASADRRNASVHQKFVTCTFSIIHTDLHLDIS